MALQAGMRLGAFEILAPLGAGGMGEVYRAKDTRLGREVAVKVVSERLTDDPNALARLEREARAVAALSHPNIVALHDFNRENGIAFAVMELLEGEPLDRHLATEDLPWRRALEIGAAIADGLASAHAKGFVHRDLKPANIFITRDGLVKILDFGLAHRDPCRSKSPTIAAPGPDETEPGAILGTVGYMSPEQVKGGPADHRTDIFSLGCVLYEVLTGRKPFRGDTSAETLAAILRDHPSELAAVGRTFPPRIDALVRRCLEKNPDYRFQSARDLAFAMREILSDSEGL
ncbi:MAG: serine/threonine-protein kinase, partial [Vicinamibacterales bacterium]